MVVTGKKIAKWTTIDKLLYIDAVLSYIEKHLPEEINPESIAVQHFVSPRQLYRDFYACTGHSVKEYIRKRRISNACVKIKYSKLPLSVIAEESGYQTQQAFHKQKIKQTPKSYSPKVRPELLRMVENVNNIETFVEKINDFCCIVDRTELNLVGIGVPVTFESQGYPNKTSFESNTLNDYFIAKKYISNGTIAFLAETLGVKLNETEIISARYDVHGDGNYNVITGFPIDSFDELSEFLPEHTVTFTLPACRYAKMEINEQKREGRIGYGERMQADEYFIGGFRSDTEYIFDLAGFPMNTWDATGDLLTKYEPIRKPENETDCFDTFECKPVLLPPWKIACCSSPHDDRDNRCIFDYFKVADEVYKTGLARYDQGDFYGFPIDWENSFKGCFGSRVSSFDGLPDSVERITLPGGLYIHVTQKEFNGDNPSMPYDVAFNHMDKLYFSSHSEYEFDNHRKVIARFRQANCASVFVPIRRRKVDHSFL